MPAASAVHMSAFAQSVLSEMSAYLSAFGAKQTWAAARSRSSPPLLTQSGHRRFEIPQRSRLLALWCALSFGAGSTVAPRHQIQNDSGLTQGLSDLPAAG